MQRYPSVVYAVPPMSIRPQTGTARQETLPLRGESAMRFGSCNLVNCCTAVRQITFKEV